VTRPPDRFDDDFIGRDAAYNEIREDVERNIGRGLYEYEEEDLYGYFTAFLPEHRGDYPRRPLTRAEIWEERYEAYVELQLHLNRTFNGNYDLADYFDDEKAWRQNYEQVS